MNLSEVLAELSDRGVKLWAEREELRLRAPVGKLTPELRNAVAENKAEIVVLLHQRNVSASVTSIPLVPVPRNGHLPLSFAQERLWFLDQLEGPSATYNVPAGLKLSGPLDVRALERSLGEVVRRHEVLRTTFPTAEGVAAQVVAPEVVIELPMVGLEGLSNEAQGAEVGRLAAEEARRPFDLARGPLLRVALLKLEEEEHGLLLTAHHIVADGWSREVFIRELSALYQAFSRGAPSPLVALPIQYADFAEWQRRWLSGEMLEGQLAYWRGQLAGAPALLELPTDHPRPPVQSFRGATVAFGLDRALTHGLKVLSQRAGMTLFMTLLTGFLALLSRYSGQEDLVVGTPVANRNRRETEGLIGFFVNTLVLRVDLAGNPTFEALLGRVRQVALEAYAHQEVPFERVVEALEPERSLSHSPLFQVAFALQSAPLGDPLGELELPGLSLSPLPLESGVAKFDLSLSMSETEQGLLGEWEYSTDLFERSTIERWGVHFETLLRGIVAEPTQRLADLPLLTEAEWQRVVVEWNQTQAPYLKGRCIHELFETQVEQTPAAIAAVFENEHLTYGALNARANQLAHTLQGLGVGPEVLVGICLERSLELVVGLLGVLKAGGAYVPLDPSYPSERLAFMLEDAQAAVLLTQQHLLGTLPLTPASVICLDRAWERVREEPESTPPSPVTPQNLAYVIYTSGSTGRPKGTLLPHRGLCNVSEAQVRTFGLGPGDLVLQFASFSFDASTFEIVMALRSGATLCLGKRENLLHGPALIRLLQDRAITLVTLPPSALAPLPTEALPALRTITVAGEACPAELAAHWAEGRRFFNLYGPTEGTIWATTEEYRGDGHTLPIGRPLINTQVYLLDPHLQPVPLGVPGELYIGGVGLARGYLQRPELTSEKFLPDPFSELPGARLYRTGDLARYLPDGNLEFLGRIDHQVKVRGFRIELGEIEAVLGSHPGVQEACAVVREDHPGEKRLVGYYVPREGVVEPEALRGYLQGKLPEYMVPGALVGLEALPLTPNGKVDRKALPAPERGGAEEAYVPPHTPTEELLAGIWAEVLRQERVGRQDNFFALGGDSILSIQIVARAQQAGLSLTPKQIFQYQSIAELAAVVGTGPGREAEQGVVSGAVPLTPIQRWFFEQHPPEPHHFNQAVLLEVGPALKPVWAQRVVRELLLQHDALRLRFIPEGVGWRQVHGGLEEAVPFGVVDLSGLAHAQQRLALEAVAGAVQASLDLATGPLLRVVLFRLGPRRPGRLLLVIHHLAVDGVSWRVLLEDFERAYGQLSQGEAIELPPKSTAFKGWAERLAQYEQAPAVRAELDYWRGVCQAVVPLPRDYAVEPEANTVAAAAEVGVALSTEQTRALLQEVPPVYHTQINDVLLTALVQSLVRWTGERALLLDLEGHGREELFGGVDLSRTVGWFTTLFPVRLALETQEPGEALKAVKEQLRAIPKGGLGYGVLRYLCPDPEVRAALHGLPQAEVSFNYLGQWDAMFSDGSLLRPAPEGSGPPHSPLGRRPHLLEVNGWVVEGRLQLQWTYSTAVHRRATVEHLAQGFIEALQALIAHCQSPEAGGFTPSDFPLVRLGTQTLNKLSVLLEGD